jgi:hypothetical protein
MFRGIILPPSSGLQLQLDVVQKMQFCTTRPTDTKNAERLRGYTRNKPGHQTSSGEADEIRVRNMATEFCRRASIMLVGFFNMP